jgi:spore maturation protein SpmB
MAFKEVSEIIKSIQKKIGLTDELFVILKVWEHLNIGGSRAVGLKNTTLVVEADAAIIAGEILNSKRQIIAKLNQYIGSGKIKNIKINIAGAKK